MEPLVNPVKEKEYTSIRFKLRTLYNKIKYLQKDAKYKPSTGDAQVTKLRNALFEELLLMYDRFTSALNNKEEMDKVYNLLNNIKIEIIKALKLSVTGNSRSIPEDQCLCRDTFCAVPNSTKNCQRICSSFPVFSRYLCKKTNKQVYVPVESLCDGKFDCPKFDDELYCKKGRLLRFIHNELVKILMLIL